MRKTHSYLKTNRKKRILRDAPKSCDTNKIRFKKKRLCLKCGKKFLSKGPYNRICEKCGSINERIATSTYSVSSKPSDEPNLLEDRFYELN
ncbi:MAG: hypothetical protein SCARUB_02027 [Candidatus Scalindua rubra]|uniref:Uncharacterized protein n=1 Tax=Candidatus Scalindua rubra TaxID=1872076 RepID=A0A1E3XB08_9BACT|nr:MAG: hypothetical protein SCARUB_02027 [Candidatus Scalindua rubra]